MDSPLQLFLQHLKHHVPASHDHHMTVTRVGDSLLDVEIDDLVVEVFPIVQSVKVHGHEFHAHFASLGLVVQ